MIVASAMVNGMVFPIYFASEKSEQERVEGVEGRNL